VRREIDVPAGPQAEILAALMMLATARQAEFDGGAQRTYVRLLQDVDSSLVLRACQVLAKRQREAFAPAMPSVADVRQVVHEVQEHDALDARQRALAPMPLSDEDGPRFYCLSCRDETHSWRPFWCPGAGSARSMDRPDYAEGSICDCGVTRRHAPHAYVARCECYETNPVSAERRRRETVAAAARKSRAA
jgi:hypothetical protein